MERMNTTRQAAKDRIFRVLADADKAKCDDDTLIEQLVDAGMQVISIDPGMAPPPDAALDSVENALQIDERVWRAYQCLKTIHREKLLERLYQAANSELAAKVEKLERKLLDACEIGEKWASCGLEHEADELNARRDLNTLAALVASTGPT